MEIKTLEPAGGQAQETTEEEVKESKEEAPAGGEETKSKESAADPLDEISDIEELRKEAKKHRSIHQRHKEGSDLSKPTSESKDSKSDTLSKKDFYKINEKTAIERVTAVSDADSDETKSIKKDLDANWSEIVKYYSPKSGRDRVEDIEKDIYSAVAAWRFHEGRKAPVKTDEEVRAGLATDKGKQGGKPTASKGKAASKIPTPTSMENWYPKK